MKRRKLYAYTRDPATGQRVLAHRHLAAQALGRSLLPREVVHHRNGDSLDNALSNLIVLPNQRVHAHVEFHTRRSQAGMSPLFPEHFKGVPSATGTLFDHLLLWEGPESPKPERPWRKPKVQESALPHEPAPLWAKEEDEPPRLELVISDPRTPGPHTLRDLLACICVRDMGGESLAVLRLAEVGGRKS